MTPLLIILGYLFVLFVLGQLSGRLFRGTTADFFVASRSIGPFLLLMSIFGTTMTAFALVGSTAEAFRVGIGPYGLMASWSGLIHSACFFFIGLKLWSLGKRHGYHTQIQFFRDRFESNVIGYILFPILVGLVIPYLLIGIVGAGSLLRAVTIGALPGLFPETKGALPSWLTGALITVIVLTYVCRGGVRSAAWANAFQTLIFMTMALVAFLFIANRLGGPVAASSMANPEKLIRSGNMGQLQFFTYCFIPLSVAMFPHLFQHWLTAKSAKSFRLTLVAHPLCILVTWIPCILIGIWATGALIDGQPVLPPGVSPNATLGLMVSKLTNPVISGLVAAGVLAAIMSSLDSQFVCLGTMFTQDIVLHTFGKDRFSETQTVWTARGFICLVAVVAYLCSLFEPRQIFAIGIWCFSGFASLFPLVCAALYWKGVTKAGALVAIGSAALAWLLLFRASDYGAEREFLVGGAMPVTVTIAVTAVTLFLVSVCTKPPAPATLAKFFPEGARKED